MPRTLVGGWCLASRSFSNSYSFVSGLNAKWWPKSRKASILGSSPLRGKIFFSGTVEITLIVCLYHLLLDKTSRYACSWVKRAEVSCSLSKPNTVHFSCSGYKLIKHQLGGQISPVWPQREPARRRSCQAFLNVLPPAPCTVYPECPGFHWLLAPWMVHYLLSTEPSCTYKPDSKVRWWILINI